MTPSASTRHATDADVPALRELIARSGHVLSVPYYTPEEADAITRYVFGVDSQLIVDRTYFVAESEAAIVACGGWSKRRTLFGGDHTKAGPDLFLDPATDSARIRAFFVDPEMARRGLGRMLMNVCVDEARGAGFRSLELVSSLPGEPFYLSSGFTVLERFALDLPGGVRVPVSRMGRWL